MHLQQDCLDPICFWLGQHELLQALLVCRHWCRTVKSTDAWKLCFIWFWLGRQKPGFIRAWWKELAYQGEAYLPALSMTAWPSYVNWNKKFAGPESMASSCQDHPTSWYQKFACAARDMSVRRAPTEDELCYDNCFDPFSGQQFPRCWRVLNRDGLEDLPSEIQFHPDGRILDHRQRRVSVWTWKWGSTHTSFLELIRASERKVAVFLFFRDSAGGFVLHDLTDRMICSRELTLEEHTWYSHGVRHHPVSLVDVVQAMANNPDSTNVRMPMELTAFEHSVIQMEVASRPGMRSVPNHTFDTYDTVIFSPKKRFLSPIEQAWNSGGSIEWPGNSIQLRFLKLYSAR
jgi:hypothetical protein